MIIVLGAIFPTVLAAILQSILAGIILGVAVAIIIIAVWWFITHQDEIGL